MNNNRSARTLSNWLEFIASVIAGMLMFCLVLITFVDVVGRQFGYPLSFAFEFTQLTVGLMFYTVLPLVTLRREHITVDLIAVRSDSCLFLVSNVFVNILCAVAIAITAKELWVQGETLAMFNTMTMFTRWPIAPFVYFMSLLAIITALIFVSLALIDIKYARRFKKD